MIYSFISLLFCPDPDPQIYADPDPGRAKTCGSVRIRNPAWDPSRLFYFQKSFMKHVSNVRFLIKDNLVAHLEVDFEGVVEVLGHNDLKNIFASCFCIWLVACKVSLTELKVKDKTHPPPKKKAKEKSPQVSKVAPPPYIITEVGIWDTMKHIKYLIHF